MKYIWPLSVALPSRKIDFTDRSKLSIIYGIMFRVCHTFLSVHCNLVRAGFLAFLYVMYYCFVCLFDLILYVPSTIFQLYRDRSSWVEPVLS